jgi:hypothetical protein
MTQKHASMKYNATVPEIASLSTGKSPEGNNARLACMSKERIEEPGSKFFIFIVIAATVLFSVGLESELLGTLGGVETVKEVSVVARESVGQRPRET